MPCNNLLILDKHFSMKKEEIVKQLEDSHQVLLMFLEHQPKELWTKGPEGKWTTGQHALHLLQSIKKLNDALSLPRLILKYKFGIANREVRDFNTVTNRYQERLAEASGATFKNSRNMKIPPLSDKNYIITRLQMENKKLQYKTTKISDADLDKLVLPHPLMGKMPLREIIMWTAYHVLHHTKTLAKNYNASQLD